MAESEELSWALLGQNLSSIPTSAWSTFSPMNTETGVRVGDESSSNMAYFPALNQTTEIGGVTIHYLDRSINVTLLDLSDISVSYDRAALDFWVYLEDASGRDFHISLVFENDNVVDFGFSYLNIINETKDSQNDGNGWIHLRHFFTEANVVDMSDIYDVGAEKFYKIKQVRIYQDIGNTEIREETIGLYKLQIISAQKVQNETQIVEKQPYICYNFDFSDFYGELSDQVFAGDKWQIPNLTLQPKAYIWYGKQNLIASLYLVVNNDATQAIKVGGTLTFEHVNKYDIVVAAKTANNLFLYIPQSFRTVNIFEFIGISLPYKKITGEVNNKYTVKFETNNQLDNVKDLQIAVKNGIIEIEDFDAEKREFTFKMLDAGTSQIKITCRGTRGGVEQEYEAVLDVVSSNISSERDTLLLISTVLCLGFAFIAGVVFVIKITKNANKYNVK